MTKESGFDSRHPQEIFTFCTEFTPSETQPPLYSMDIFSVTMRPTREAYRSPTSSAKFVNI